MVKKFLSGAFWLTVTLAALVGIFALFGSHAKCEGTNCANKPACIIYNEGRPQFYCVQHAVVVLQTERDK
mgnify:FL=1